MPVGTVKWFDSRKGYGFIKNDSGPDIFVHFSVIEGTGFRQLLDREIVEFDVQEGPKGFLATRVKRTEKREPKP